MGLDNIPHVYPCVKAGTAIMTDEGRIDCDGTIAAERCPWTAAYPERFGTPTIGLMGAPCWFRGKAGNWMLSMVQSYGPPEEGFYGDKPQEEEGPHLGPDYCNELAEWMEDHVEAFAQEVGKDVDVGGAEHVKQHVEGYRYAAWWLRFVAEHAGGSDVWY